MVCSVYEGIFSGIEFVKILPIGPFSQICSHINPNRYCHRGIGEEIATNIVIFPLCIFMLFYISRTHVK